MAELSERHEVKIRGRDKTIVFSAASEDGRLIIRQIPDGKRSKELCTITLADPEELHAFFRGLQRIVTSLEHATEPVADKSAPTAKGALARSRNDDDRETIIAQAREKNPQAFAPWSRQEEQEVKRRFEEGENIREIARAHKRSPRAIELRLQRLGLMPPESRFRASSINR